MALLLVIPIAMRSSAAPYMFSSVYAVPPTEVAVILGASVANGLPSPVLAARSDVAIALYREGKVKKILVTGDNGALSHDEVTPVRKYLTDHGIPAPDIFLDHAGFDTYSSMYRARDIFAVRSMTIATQDFHLPRALWIARHLGIVAYGVIAPGSGDLDDSIREVPAAIKALWNVGVGRVPKYLGAPIPISGDGRETWY
jgi:SanA protein